MEILKGDIIDISEWTEPEFLIYDDIETIKMIRQMETLAYVLELQIGYEVPSVTEF